MVTFYNQLVVMVNGDGAIVSIANGTGGADTAIVDYAMIELVGQHEALHAEQQQQ
jgi:hypothetical protein